MRYLEKILAPIGFVIKLFVSVCVAKATYVSVSVTKLSAGVFYSGNM